MKASFRPIWLPLLGVGFCAGRIAAGDGIVAGVGLMLATAIVAAVACRFIRLRAAPVQKKESCPAFTAPHARPFRVVPSWISQRLARLFPIAGFSASAFPNPGPLASACSLHSKQCAMLIALAAAAGIARFEPVPSNEGNGAKRSPDAAERAISVRGDAAPIPFLFASRPPIHVRITAASCEWAPDPRVCARPSRMNDECDGERDSSAVAVLDSAVWPSSRERAVSEEIFVAWAWPWRTAREHVLPYAVGPPSREPPTKTRAAGTEVPCDSAARGRSASRIAGIFALASASGTSALTQSLAAATSSLELSRASPCAASRPLPLRRCAAIYRGFAATTFQASKPTDSFRRI
jgi:hypothetical protein